MAITQKHKVEFEVTTTMPTDVEQLIAKELIKLAEAVSAGETHLDGRLIDPQQKHMLSLFIEGGTEAVASFTIRATLRNAIRKISSEFHTFKFSPAIVCKVGG